LAGNAGDNLLNPTGFALEIKVVEQSRAARRAAHFPLDIRKENLHIASDEVYRRFI